MDAALFAQIAGTRQPDAAEIGVEYPDDIVGDALEFAFQWNRRKQRLLQQIDTLLPPARGLVFLFRLDAILARSPVIGWIYRLENGIAAAFRIPLQP